MVFTKQQNCFARHRATTIGLVLIGAWCRTTQFYCSCKRTFTKHLHTYIHTLFSGMYALHFFHFQQIQKSFHCVLILQDFDYNSEAKFEMPFPNNTIDHQLIISFSSFSWPAILAEISDKKCRLSSSVTRGQFGRRVIRSSSGNTL
jgi:hypothetical protein